MDRSWITIFLIAFFIIPELSNAKNCCKRHAKKYYFSKTMATNDEAHKLCVKQGLRLASVQSEFERLSYEEDLKLAGISEDEENGRTWIAGQLGPSEAAPLTWTWQFGELYLREKMNYTNWYQGFPNYRSTGLCVYTSIKAYSLKWANVDCDKRYFVACEKMREN